MKKEKKREENLLIEFIKGECNSDLIRETKFFLNHLYFFIIVGT